MLDDPERLRLSNQTISGSITATNVVTQLGVPVRFNTVTTTTLTSAFNTHFTDNILRVGVNYRFGGPVVAKY